MSTALTPDVGSFERATGDELSAVAASITSHAAANPELGILVVIVRPDDDEHRVLSGGDNGVLRAAVSVAVSGGLDRLWAGAPVGDTAERAVRTLPEIVRAAADGSGASAAHIGAVSVRDAVRCVAIWFETPSGLALVDDRRNALQLLAAAAERDDDYRANIALATPEPDTGSPAPDPAGDMTPIGSSARRAFDTDDPNLDPVTGLATRDRFTEVLEDFESDQASLLLVDIDGLAAIRENYGVEVADTVVRVVADRVVTTCRSVDVLARLSDDQFAVFFDDPDRTAAVQVSKRLLAMIAEPLGIDGGPPNVTATIAFAHQHGLVDIEELFDSADGALASAKRSGPGRLVLAA